MAWRGLLRTTVWTVAVFSLARGVSAQPETYPVSFEVASIKPFDYPAGREGGNRMRIEHTPTSLSMFNVSVADCVQWAYDVAAFQVSAPHLSSETYEILARTASPVPLSQLGVMLRNLLETRFKLGFHRETRMAQVYALTVAKGGPKFPAPNRESSPLRAAESLPRVEKDSFIFADVSMAQFCRMFGQLRGIELPVVDQTRISGSYDLVLKSAPAAAREGDTSALFAIVQEQLGLKLSAAKAPVEVLAIDRAEKPSAN